MNKFKVLFSFAIITVLFFTTNLPVLAADLNIDCPTPPAACSKTGSDPLFSSATDGFWYPGKILTKTINLKNSSTEAREMAIKGERKSPTNILEEMMHISIAEGTTAIWEGSVENFYNQNKIGMGIFDPGADLDYDFTVSMSSDADDNYQNRETVFDLTLGFWEDPILQGAVHGASTGPDGLLGIATGADLIYSVLGSLTALSTGLYLRRRSSTELA